MTDSENADLRAFRPRTKGSKVNKGKDRTAHESIWRWLLFCSLRLMENGPQLIEHAPQKRKFKSRLARFWSRRSYAFKATTYGLAGSTLGVFAMVAVEICAPGAGVLGKLAYHALDMSAVVTLGGSFYLAAREARKHHPVLSQVVGKNESNLITWASAAGVGLPYWYVGFFPPLMTKMAYNAVLPVYQAGYEKMAMGIGGLFAAFCFFAMPAGAFIIKHEVERRLRERYQVYPGEVVVPGDTAIEDQRYPGEPAPPGTRRIDRPRDKPFSMK